MKRGDDHPEYLALRAACLRLHRYAGRIAASNGYVSGEELRTRLDAALHPKPDDLEEPIERLKEDVRKAEARDYGVAIGSVMAELARISEDAPADIRARLQATVETLGLLKRDGATPKGEDAA